jgi:hypothetical protein
VAAGIASLHVPSQRSSPTERNRPNRSPLLHREGRTKLGQVSGSVLLEDVRHFQTMLGHPATCLAFGSGSSSSRLGAERSVFSETWVYLAVVLKLRCPSKIWIVRRSVPASSR